MEKGLNSRLLDPKSRHWRRYPGAGRRAIQRRRPLQQLESGSDGVGDEDLLARGAGDADRGPDFPRAIRRCVFRQHIPTGMDRAGAARGPETEQVRRMTAAVGFPTPAIGASAHWGGSISRPSCSREGGALVFDGTGGCARFREMSFLIPPEDNPRKGKPRNPRPRIRRSRVCRTSWSCRPAARTSGRRHCCRTIWLLWVSKIMTCSLPLLVSSLTVATAM